MTELTHRNSSIEYLNWLGSIISECEMPNTFRIGVAARCLAIAQDHHHAIVALIDHKLYASSFALVRCAFEAYVRGEWIALCATDEEINAFSNGIEPPKLGCLLEALEKTEAFSEKILSQIRKKSWSDMCAYTHTGGLHIQRWGNGNCIEPNYSVDEIKEVLSFTEIIGTLTVIGIAVLANNEPIANEILSKFRDRF
ncbi:MAG: hypothetical protein ACEQSE_02055 [Candidatus Aquirickettsiella gammari]